MSSDIDYSGLDPQDWPAFRDAAHRLLDQCIDQLQSADAHPWQPVPKDIRAAYHLETNGAGISAAELTDRIISQVLPYGTGNTHPRFFGWVHGTGLAEGLLSEMAAATLNSNCGGRDHGMVYLERAVIDWARRQMGFPDSASGVLVGGTSQATVNAMAAARVRKLGDGVRANGNPDTRLTIYAGASVHNALRKAVELLGIGHNNLRLIPEGAQGMDIAALRQQIAVDRANGAAPMAIVGTAGSVDFGYFDDIDALADVARDEDLWLHIDGAFGAWIRLADDPWRRLGKGIERADSLACDFHKWMYVPYDCGLCLIRDEEWHRAAFAARPSYLAPLDAGLAGGDPWFCDYGTDLSRGNRALKVWSAIQTHGAKGMGAAITGNCMAAAQMGNLITNHPRMQLARPVLSNLCVFTADSSLSAAKQSALNADIAIKLQLSGAAVFSTVEWDGVTYLRAAITNHRTRRKDVELAFKSVAEMVD